MNQKKKQQNNDDNDNDNNNNKPSKQTESQPTSKAINKIISINEL